MPRIKKQLLADEQATISAEQEAADEQEEMVAAEQAALDEQIAEYEASDGQESDSDEPLEHDKSSHHEHRLDKKLGAVDNTSLSNRYKYNGTGNTGTVKASTAFHQRRCQIIGLKVIELSQLVSNLLVNDQANLTTALANLDTFVSTVHTASAALNDAVIV